MLKFNKNDRKLEHCVIILFNLFIVNMNKQTRNEYFEKIFFLSDK